MVIVQQFIRTTAFALMALAIHAGLVRAYFRAETPASWTLATDAQLHARDSIDLDWLILGDSHAKCGIEAHALPNAFNLATLGSHYFHTYYRLRHFLTREGGSARFVILPMDTHSLAWQRRRMEDGPYWAQYISYPEMAWRTGDAPGYARQFLSDYCFPYAGKGDRLVDAALGRLPAETRFPLLDGFIRMPGDWSLTPAEERLRLTRQRCAFIHDGYQGPDPVMERYFADTLALCAAYGVRVVMVRFPLTGEAWDVIADHLDLAELDARFDALLAPYPDIVRIDLGRALEDRLDLFNDPDHLNGEGAAVFTRILVEVLMTQGLLEPAPASGAGT